MTSRDFAYWLQGFFELAFVHKSAENRGLTPTQSEMIQNHLNLVFKHEIDPSMGGKEHQNQLNQIHNSDWTFPTTEEQAIQKWGPKPSPEHEFSIHGWYHPDEGVPRC